MQIEKFQYMMKKFFSARWKALITAMALCLPLTAVQADLIKMKDVAGREIQLEQPAQRIILADSRILQALQLVKPENTFQSVIALDDALKTKAPDLYNLYTKSYPQLAKLPVFQNPLLTDFSVEKAIMLHPDLIIFDVAAEKKLASSGAMEQLAALKIPVAFTDFRLHPLTNSTVSIRLLGQALGNKQAAEDYIQFYQSRLDMIRQRTASLRDEQRPSVFIERHAGMTGEECCFTYGAGSFGEFIQLAGGKNIGSTLFKGKNGVMSLEQLISSNPDMYLMTGADWGSTYHQSIGVPLGYNADRALSQQRMQKLMERQGISVLKAAQDKQVMAVYHQYYDNPMNVLAVEAIAKFLHPDLFTDLDPQADIQMVHEKFMHQPFNGTFWLMLPTPQTQP